MVYTIYCTNKKTGVTHAYASESYRDPVTKKTKARRTYLGRVDPVTKMIIPKAPPGSRNRTKLSEVDDGMKLPPEVKRMIASQTDAIASLRAELDALKVRNRELLLQVKRLNAATARMLKILTEDSTPGVRERDGGSSGSEPENGDDTSPGNTQDEGGEGADEATGEDREGGEDEERSGVGSGPESEVQATAG